jgi:hypothetical protein
MSQTLRYEEDTFTCRCRLSGASETEILHARAGTLLLCRRSARALYSSLHFFPVRRSSLARDAVN